MLKQIWATLVMGLSTIPARRGASLVIVIGMICAIGALVSVQSISAGVNQMMHANGRADRAIVLSRNALFESISSIPHDAVTTIADAPGVKRDANGKPIISADAAYYAAVTKKSDGLETFIQVRGMGPNAMALHPEIKLLSGRMYQPGKYEVIVGKSAAEQFNGLTEGARVALPDGDWNIVGTFESNGSTLQSALLTDADTLLASARGTNYKSVTVMLTSPAAFPAFKNALTANPSLTVDPQRETEFNERETRQLNGLLGVVAAVVGITMGLGAMFGALNTMYSAVSARTVEIATLRAIGFGGFPIIVSVLAEALLLAATGALIGALLAWAAFNGNVHTIGGTVIHLAVTPALITNGILFACLLGFIGGLFPALRAVRRPITDALRAT